MNILDISIGSGLKKECDFPVKLPVFFKIKKKQQPTAGFCCSSASFLRIYFDFPLNETILSPAWRRKKFPLVVEQTNTGKCHGNSVFIAGFNNIVIPHRTARLGNIFDTALVGTLNIVAKWEECVGA